MTRKQWLHRKIEEYKGYFPALSYNELRNLVIQDYELSEDELEAEIEIE